MITIEEMIECFQDAISRMEDNIEHIVEHAIKIDKLHDGMVSQGNHIVEHAIKILLYRDYAPETVNHWCSEIKGALPVFYKLKKSNNRREKPEKAIEKALEEFNSVASVYEFRIEADEEDYEEKSQPDTVIYNKVCDFVKTLINLTYDKKVELMDVRKLVDKFLR